MESLSTPYHHPIEAEKRDDACERHGQNMTTKACYGFEYVQHELGRIATAFERIAAALERYNE